MIRIVLKGVTKKYGDVRAISGITTDISQPGIYGIVGENGSGKTTLLKIMNGLVSPNSGSREYFDPSGRIPLMGALAHISSLIEVPRFNSDIRGTDLIRLAESVTGSADPKHIEGLIARLQIKSFIDRKVSHYSRGMLQRLLLAHALVAKPEVIILDEPTSGLDPGSKSVFMREVLNQKESGKTIIMTSHDVWEIETICDYATGMSEGKLLFEWMPLKDKDMVYSGNRDNIFSKNNITQNDTVSDGLISLNVCDIATAKNPNSKKFDFLRVGSSFPLRYLKFFNDEPK
jgi:ABC-type multidrug transport system ATPase subunit